MAMSYNYYLVALSVAISTLASYAALDLAGRVTAARGLIRTAWLTGGACAMGMGIWAMHYIGMLCLQPSRCSQLRSAHSGRILVACHSSLRYSLICGQPPADDAGPPGTRHPGHGRWRRRHALHWNGSDAATCDRQLFSSTGHAFDFLGDPHFPGGIVAFFYTPWGAGNRSGKKVASALLMGVAIR